MYCIQTARMRFTPVIKAAHATPYVWLGAVIVVAVKLVFGLGNTLDTVSGCLWAVRVALCAVRTAASGTTIAG